MTQKIYQVKEKVDQKCILQKIDLKLAPNYFLNHATHRACGFTVRLKPKILHLYLLKCINLVGYLQNVNFKVHLMENAKNVVIALENHRMRKNIQIMPHLIYGN